MPDLTFAVVRVEHVVTKVLEKTASIHLVTQTPPVLRIRIHKGLFVEDLPENLVPQDTNVNLTEAILTLGENVLRINLLEVFLLLYLNFAPRQLLPTNPQIVLPLCSSCYMNY